MNKFTLPENSSLKELEFEWRILPPSRTEVWRDSLLPPTSPYKKRIEEIGFEFNKIDLETDGRMITIRGAVHCMCGKTERFQMMVSMEVVEYALAIPDMYERLMPNFSPKHLEEDGFPPEVVEKAKQIWSKPIHPPSITQPINGFDYGNPGSDLGSDYFKW